MPASSRIPVSELSPGDRVDDAVYLVAQKDLRTTSNGGLYIHVVIADKSGQMLARMWNASQDMYDTIPDGGLLHFRGRVESYKGQKQFIIDGLRSVERGEANPADFLPSTTQDIEQMWERLKTILRNVKNPHVLALVGKFINDPDFASGFKRAPAATKNHHAFIGGLLEHTLGLLELALVVVPRYPNVSLDLVLAGILLHDCGKVRELAYDSNFAYTEEGQLLGHIAQGLLWLHDKAGDIEAETGKAFPRDIENALKHIILAHHGKYEFGSPKLPATLEAIAVHYLDNLDAKLNQFQFEIEKDADASTAFTDYVPSLETKVYKKDVMGIRAARGATDGAGSRLA